MKRSESRATITGEATLAILHGAMHRARDLHCKIAVAVVDPAGLLVGFVASHGVARISHDVAKDKAFTAAMTGMPTIEWKNYMDAIPGHEREIILRHRHYIGADGGFPIRDGEHVIGGVGASGASQEIDAECALAGLAALEAAD